MSLDKSKLENVRESGGGYTARCPACKDEGRDKKGDHLAVDADGAFACVTYQKPDGDEHRALIYKLAGNHVERPEKSEWTPRPPAPKSAPAPALNHPEFGTPEKMYIYRTEDGRMVGATARFETPGGKETRPIAWCRDQHGNEAWKWRMQPAPRTIYGLPFNDRAVVIVEGEKCADAVKDAGLPAVTWQGGAPSVAKSDWSPLAGKICYIWPDNDEPGFKAKDDLIASLAGIAAEILVIQIPAGMPKGWDAGDTTTEEIRRLVGDADSIDPADYPQPEPEPEPQTEPETKTQAPPKRSIIVRGISGYPTAVPPETVLLGNSWLRRGDIGTLISTAGAGKSVAAFQAAMAWGLGLPYFGIHPSRPLRILIFSGEDDGVTIGQCREGFLEHSEIITGTELYAEDMDPLFHTIRTEFSREYVGERFHGHLDRLLTEAPADLVIINPLMSYLGDEVVKVVSQWLRTWLMPILQKHDCGALVAHHTNKMTKDGWDNTDDTYAGIGGGEVANVPRTILTLRPTPADGISVVNVSKRQTTGWKDGKGKYTAKYFIRRSENPDRPAWIPVPFDEAEELIGTSTAAKSNSAKESKVTPDDVVSALQPGPTQRAALIDRLMKRCQCSDRPVKNAIIHAEGLGLVVSFSVPNPKGQATKWFRLPEHKPSEGSQ